MSDTNAAYSAHEQITLGCFEVGNLVVALDVAHVREVVRWQRVTPLPKSPQLIEGVIDLRGAVVPVVDLGRVLNECPVEVSNRARVAIVETDGLVVGFGVDAAVEVLQIAVASLEPPPSLATQAGYDAARGIVRFPDSEPIVVLSVQHLLESVYRSALPAHEDAA